MLIVPEGLRESIRVRGRLVGLEKGGINSRPEATVIALDTYIFAKGFGVALIVLSTGPLPLQFSRRSQVIPTRKP